MDRPKYQKRCVRDVCACVTVGAEHLNKDHRKYRCHSCTKYGNYTTQLCVGCGKFRSDLNIYKNGDIICWDCDDIELFFF